MKVLKQNVISHLKDKYLHEKEDMQRRHEKAFKIAMNTVDYINNELRPYDKMDVWYNGVRSRVTSYHLEIGGICISPYSSVDDLGNGCGVGIVIKIDENYEQESNI